MQASWKVVWPNLMTRQLLQEESDVDGLQVREPKCKFWPHHMEILMRVLSPCD